MLLIADVIMFVKLVLRDGRPCGDQPVQQGDMDSHEDRITGDFRQHAVKFNVRTDKQRVVIQRLAVDLQRLLSNLLVAGVFCGIANQTGLKNRRSCSKCAIPPG
jgi:hypothetical protein